MWDLNGTLLATLQGHYDQITRAAFSPDGQTIVTASGDGTAKVWPVYDLPQLIERSCDWLEDLLTYDSPLVTNEDRAICNLPPRASSEPSAQG